MTVTGTGSATSTSSGGYDFGVFVLGGSMITARSGTGDVAVTGVGGQGGGNSYGVYLRRTAATITSDYGSVTVSGTGGGMLGGAGANYGVYRQHTAVITSGAQSSYETVLPDNTRPRGGPVMVTGTGGVGIQRYRSLRGRRRLVDQLDDNVRHGDRDRRCGDGQDSASAYDRRAHPIRPAGHSASQGPAAMREMRATTSVSASRPGARSHPPASLPLWRGPARWLVTITASWSRSSAPRSPPGSRPATSPPLTGITGSAGLTVTGQEAGAPGRRAMTTESTSIAAGSSKA